MASKLEQLRQIGGGNVAESTGANRGNGLPPGIDLGQASGMPARLVGLTKEKGAARIPVARIVRDESQPREEFDQESLEMLAESLRSKGQLQPIRVRWDEGRGSYVVLVGERRWRAAAIAGLEDLSCIIHEAELDEIDRLTLQLVENALREDLKPIEQARSYRRLMEARSWTTRQIAEELKVGQSSIVRALALLDLPPEVQVDVERGRLAPSVAAEVAKIPDRGEQVEVAAKVMAEGLSRDETAAIVKRTSGKGKGKAKLPSSRTIRTASGFRVTVEARKGFDEATMLEVLREVVSRLEAEVADDRAA
jgi:ParB family chromosome partitioning protein